jgi:hypothetical protein
MFRKLRVSVRSIPTQPSFLDRLRTFNLWGKSGCSQGNNGKYEREICVGSVINKPDIDVKESRNR